MNTYLPADVPSEKEAEFLENFTRATGGGKVNAQAFLSELHAQIQQGQSRGNGTGRNIHQRPLAEAVKMAGAIYAVTVKNATVEEAVNKV